MSAKIESDDGKKRALGRGLSALLPGSPPPSMMRESAAAAVKDDGPARVHFTVAVEEISPNPEQPRRLFAEPELEELAQSIRAHGVIQPVIVRKNPAGGFFLIAGERRWRASQRAGLLQIPVVISEVTAKESFERALIENIQRADLNPMEEAEAYHRLIEQYGLTQEQVAERVGKERSTVANSVRLLKLPPKVREMLEEGKLSMGHARAVLSLENASTMEQVAREIFEKNLSVRATEVLIRNKLTPPANKPIEVKSASVRDVENRLTKSLGAKVLLTEEKNGKGGGRIEIRYADLDDLDRLLARFLDSRN